MKKIAWIVVVVVLFGVYGCATTGTKAETGTGGIGVKMSLPGYINIVPPDPSVGNVAKFSGVWGGVLEKGTENALVVIIIVERITQKSVLAVYAQGPFKQEEAGWVRVTGKVSNDSIVLKWSKPPERTITLTPIDERTITAEVRGTGVVIHLTLKKTSLPLKEAEK